MTFNTLLKLACCVLAIVAAAGCTSTTAARDAGGLPDPAFAPFHWTQVTDDFVLKPGPPGSWDEHIRERMWVMYENGKFRAWYAGFNGKYDLSRPNLVHMGYATSDDGIQWTKDTGNPIYTDRWTEDMCIVKSDGQYVMFVEDETNDKTVIHRMTSPDGIAWTDHGNVIEGVPGSSFEPDWAGTPLVWKEGKKWIMLYEGGNPGDTALATSKDGIHWERYAHNPVLPEGAGWDGRITAADSITKIDGIYYVFYHARGDAWRSGMAASRDLIHWQRYSGNPVFENPSPVLVQVPGHTYMYVTHEEKSGVNGILLYESK